MSAMIRYLDHWVAVALVQSVEECPTDAHLEHEEIGLKTSMFGNFIDVESGLNKAFTRAQHILIHKWKKKLHPGMPPPTTEFNKGGSVPVIWQNQARRLPGVHQEYSNTASRLLYRSISVDVFKKREFSVSENLSFTTFMYLTLATTPFKEEQYPETSITGNEF
ncbi:hypothetical protein TNCV_284201 [Trichonephila clavipes]|uniref:Uncharacterized protein n=1 Tax=Trichonephila clavipes TaxID=2585209 RepID=A0A8X6SEC4_TRICX|nr:hypothetical protein TNCV_284201 [Trichonephila clavipes]